MMSKKAGLIVSLIATICLVLLFSITALVPKDDVYSSNETTTESTTVEKESIDVIVKNAEEYFYFNLFDEVIKWANQRYNTSGPAVVNILSEWNNISAVGEVLNCDYGFNIEKRN